MKNTTFNFRVAQRVATVGNVIKVLQKAGISGEFTKSRFEAQTKGTFEEPVSLEWLRNNGITACGEFGYLGKYSGGRPIAKLVRKEDFIMTLKQPMRKRVLVSANGSEIPIKVTDLDNGTVSSELLNQLFPQWQIATREITEINAYRNYYELDTEVVLRMIEWYNSNKANTQLYYEIKAEKLRCELLMIESKLKKLQ